MMEGVKTGSGFHGVYLLNCTNPKYRGHTYIGYTVNPARRIKQHNGGVDKGGAHKTSRKKPWEMMLIVHGFPNDVIALQFEWAWQNPQRTRRLKNMSGPRSKRTKENNVSYCFRILSELLQIGPWNRLPLTIRWLIQDYEIKFDPCRQPPIHMPIAYGPLITDTSTSKAKRKMEEEEEVHAHMYQSKICAKCSGKIKLEDSIVHCPNQDCTMTAHTICLAKAFINKKNEDGIFCLPLDGRCPSCQTCFLWRDFVKPSETLQLDNNLICDDDKPHWTQTLRQT
ncbi:hypothetical protein QZH41_016533 [Actinostola sp. cb2023]|nr:hypothetical protein QZH41_016533 [Actinostola sp. cb2023]